MLAWTFNGERTMDSVMKTHRFMDLDLDGCVVRGDSGCTLLLQYQTFVTLSIDVVGERMAITNGRGFFCIG